MKNATKPPKTVSQMIQWCIANNNTFPSEQFQRLEWDIPPEHRFAFDENDWLNITKAEFAKYCGCQPSQISRWIRKGMPVRPDGRLDWKAADRWLTRYEAEIEARRSRGWKDIDEDDGEGAQ